MSKKNEEVNDDLQNDESIDGFYNFEDYEDIDTTVEVLDADSEAELTISEAEFAVSKNSGRTNLKLKLSVVDAPNVDDIYHYVTLPDEAMRIADEKKFKKAVQRFRNFKQCFGVPSSFQPADLIGLTGTCIVGQEEGQNDGQIRNTVKTYVTGH